MKKKSIVLRLILLSLLLLFCISNYKVYAVEKDPAENPEYYQPTIGDEPELLEKAGVVLGAINTVGVVSSVIALGCIGLKYMFGSIEEKAEYKQALTPYVIGAVLVFAATTLPNLIYNLSHKLFL